MMQVGRKRSTPRNVVAGSVWESRIKLDEVKGGIKVFNGEESSEESESESVSVGAVGGSQINSISVQNQSVGVREKRKTWKLEPIEAIGGIPIQVRKTKSEPQRFSIGSCWELSGSVDVIEKTPIQVQKNRSDSQKDIFDVFESCVSGDDEDEGEAIEREIERKSFNDKEVDVSELKPKKVVKAEKKVNLLNEKPMPIAQSVKKQPTFVRDLPVDVSEQKSKKVVKESRKLNQKHEKTIPISANVKKTQPRSIDHLLIDPDITKSPPKAQRCPEMPKKFQKIVDLVMWRDVSKSAFAFGFGMLILISSSYTENLNFSLISAISYTGLIWLAAIFFYKSIICRGDKYLDDSTRKDLVGEEEAIWLSKLIISYLNELLWKLRDLFSGEPVTTMKLAGLLFVLAQCGSSITWGKIIKLGFIGVFTVPKVSSLYSESGKLWLECFWEEWDSCSYKKPLLGTIFILVWSLSSVVARIWAVFMLIVSTRYYQNSSSKEEVGRDDVRQEEKRKLQ